MKQRKYQNSIELIDLYKVISYITEHNVNNSRKWNYYDNELRRKVLCYINNSNDEYIINVINRYIEQGIIINLLSKLISRKDKFYLDSYLKTCSEDTEEFTHNLKIDEPLQETDIPDLYLYYVSKYNKKNMMTKPKVRARVLN